MVTDVHAHVMTHNIEGGKHNLLTVAERFGGEYAKKVLVATAISTLGEVGEYLRQRAQDMKIRLIENIQEMDDDALAKKLKNLWRS